MTALDKNITQGMSASPSLEMRSIGSNVGITLFYRGFSFTTRACPGVEGLLRQASVELDKHLSMQSSSTGRSHDGWLMPSP